MSSSKKNRNAHKASATMASYMDALFGEGNVLLKNKSGELTKSEKKATTSFSKDESNAKVAKSSKGACKESTQPSSKIKERSSRSSPSDKLTTRDSKRTSVTKSSSSLKRPKSVSLSSPSPKRARKDSFTKEKSTRALTSPIDSGLGASPKNLDEVLAETVEKHVKEIIVDEEHHTTWSEERLERNLIALYEGRFALKQAADEEEPKEEESDQVLYEVEDISDIVVDGGNSLEWSQERLVRNLRALYRNRFVYLPPGCYRWI